MAFTYEFWASMSPFNFSICNFFASTSKSCLYVLFLLFRPEQLRIAFVVVVVGEVVVIGVVVGIGVVMSLSLRASNSSGCAGYMKNESICE